MTPDPALAELYESRAQTYAAFGNGAIAARAERLLPPQGRVLDLGCASGGLLALLRPHAGHLAGLELSATAARAAAQVADVVVQGAIEDPELPFEAESFRPRRARRRPRAPRRPACRAAARGRLVSRPAVRSC